MMTDHSTARRVLSEVFDCVLTSDVVKTVLCDQQKDIDMKKVYGHTLVKLSVAYNMTWHYVYKTYPTKKDFANFLSLYGFRHNTEVIFNRAMLDRILNTFFHLKLGLIRDIKLDDLIKTFDELQRRLCSHEFLESQIREKLRYRYGTSTYVDEGKDNIIITIVKYIGGYIRPTMKSKAYINVVTNSMFDEDDNALLISDDEKTVMNDHEVLQYLLYKDNHLFMKLIQSTTVYVDQDYEIDMEAVRTVVDSFREFADTPVLMLNYACEWHDDLYTVSCLPEDVYDLFPRISKRHVTISRLLHPRVKGLAIERRYNLYYMLSPTQANILTNNHNFYDRYIVDSYDALSYQLPLSAYVTHYHRPVPLARNRTKTILFAGSDELYEDLKQRFGDGVLITREDDKLSCDMVLMESHVYVKYLHHVTNGAVPVVINAPTAYVCNMVSGLSVNDRQSVYNVVQKLIDSDKLLSLLSNVAKRSRILFNRDCVNMFWRLHVKHSCPIRSNNPRDGVLVYTNFIVGYALKHIEDITSLRRPHEDMANNVAVLIDNRPNYMSVMSVLFTMCNLSENWKCIVYTSDKGAKFYNEHIGDLADIIHHESLDVPKFHIDIYNKFMMNECFWQGLGKYNKCLIFQEDGVLLRKGIERFMKYDYVGAPWVDCKENDYIKQKVNPNLVGNGGFSLRSIAMMHTVCSKYVKEKTMLFYMNINNIPEDVYFAKHVLLCDGKIPDMTEASCFSSEEIINNDSLGCHKVWAYHLPVKTVEFLNNVLNTNERPL